MRVYSQGSPALSVVDARVDLHLPLPEGLRLCDGPHLLQEEAVSVHDQDVLVHLTQQGSTS